MYSELAAVDRTMRILELLASNSGGLSVTELSDRLDLHKANVSRILSTLEAGGYVHQDTHTQSFTLTWRVVALAYRYADALPLEEAAKPVLQRLADQTGELVQLAVVQHDELIFVAKVEGAKPLRVASMLGRSAPLHATAVGKAWLASLPEEKVIQLIGKRGLAPITTTTITDISKLVTQLRQIREQGYAVVWEEVNQSVVGLAVPVAAASGQVYACLVVALPAFEATPGRLEEIRSATAAAADHLADRLPPSYR
jgi:DNA-binding IclR family transcriptional regulator